MKQIDFFISYSHKDEEIVKSVVESLESAGAKCWYAPRDVVGRYAKAIVDAIGHSKIFLLCLSRNAAASEHVLNEVEMAYNKKKTMDNNLLIEPLCLEPLDLDSPELDEIMYYIRRINFISPTNLNSSKAIAQEILIKNKDYLKLNNVILKKDREQSAYFSSERETARLAIQTKLLKQFDDEIYTEVFNNYDNPDILDVGCGNGDMLFDRLGTYGKPYRLFGIERDKDKVAQAIEKYSREGVAFATGDVEDSMFWDEIPDVLETNGFGQFDIINISMLLLHLKAECSLLRKLRRLLKPEGIIIVKDIDDGINFAYPDDENLFERVYRICDNNETSGERKNGRQIYTNLYRAGFRRIALKKQGFSTIGLTYEEKEAFWGMYFQFILGDIKWMHEKYPLDADIADDCKWYENNYELLFENFMKDDFVFSLGFQMYTAKK